MTRPTSWPELQWLPHVNALYAVRLENGVIKVGRAQSARERMKDYARAFRRRGALSKFRFHVVPVGGTLHRNEAELVRRIARIATPVRGTAEFFTDVSWGAVVTLVNQIAPRQHVVNDGRNTVDYRVRAGF